LQLWKTFPKFDQDITSSTWVYKIALNVSISFYRKEQHRKKALTDYQRKAPIYEFKEEQVTAQLAQLYALIGQLKPIEKAIIILHLEVCKNAEIAEVVGISLSNVATRINRIKTKLITNTKKSNS